MVSPTIKFASALYRLDYTLRNLTRGLWMVLAMPVVLVMCALDIMTLLQPSAIASPLIAEPASPSSTSASPPAIATAPKPASVSSPSVAPAVHVVAPPQKCTPYTTYALPSPINLANQANGLNQVIDATSYYLIYGNTSAQILTQIRQCGPTTTVAGIKGVTVAAQTGYSLTWQYSLTLDGTGSCSTTNVKVGLHINTVLPQWQPASSAVSGLDRTWGIYTRNLITHENGHVLIDQQYANQLLSDLVSYPITACVAISASIQTKVDTDVAALNASNDAYDALTHYGATQGAVLP